MCLFSRRRTPIVIYAQSTYTNFVSRITIAMSGSASGRYSASYVGRRDIAADRNRVARPEMPWSQTAAAAEFRAQR